jgi:hypothetical protein
VTFRKAEILSMTLLYKQRERSIAFSQRDMVVLREWRNVSGSAFSAARDRWELKSILGGF